MAYLRYYLDRNMFTADKSSTLIMATWEHDGTTVSTFSSNMIAPRLPLNIESWKAYLRPRQFIAFHTHCATLLRHHTGLTSDSTETLIEFSLLEKILGRPQGLALAGRFNNFDYESILGDDDTCRVDIESLWSQGSSEGLNDFDWNRWKLRGLEWTATRPDV